MNVNRVFVGGRIGQDPELKTFDGGGMAVNLSVATTNKWTSKSGEAQEKTEWHKIQFWGKNAENIAKFFKKGNRILVEGGLETREYEKEGQRHFSTQINGNKWHFIDAKGDSQATPGQQGPPNPQAPSSTVSGKMIDGTFIEDDIPF